MSISNIPNARTGISDIDRILGGGIPRGRIVLVEETGSERSGFPSFFLSMKFLEEGLLNGEHGIILLTEHTASEYSEVAMFLSIDLASYGRAGNLTIIDAFTGYAGLLPENLASNADVVVESPSNTSKLFDVLRSSMTTLHQGGYHDRMRLMIDTVSTLVAAAGFQKVWNMWLGLEPIHRTTGCTTIGTYYPGMHKPEETESFERLSDGIVEFRGCESEDERVVKDFVQIKKMRRNNFIREKVRYSRSGWEMKFHPMNQLLR